MERLRLSEDRDRPVGEIAYGRQRLVEIAIALALEPRILLLDEPAAGIAAGEVGMQIVRRFAAEVTVLVHGRVMMTGSPAAVMASADVQSVYLGTAGGAGFGGEPGHA